MPPPLIAAASLSLSSQDVGRPTHETNTQSQGTGSAGTGVVSHPIPQSTENSKSKMVESLLTSPSFSDSKPKKSESSVSDTVSINAGAGEKAGGTVTSNNGGKGVHLPSTSGGLGAGKPKSFLTMMGSNSTTKKSSIKKTTTNKPAGSGGRGQVNKGKPSPLSSTHPKKGEQAPSRSSNRSIKRPRTYDEELDGIKMMKMMVSKKTKGTAKSGGVVRYRDRGDMGGLISSLMDGWNRRVKG